MRLCSSGSRPRYRPLTFESARVYYSYDIFRFRPLYLELFDANNWFCKNSQNQSYNLFLYNSRHVIYLIHCVHYSIYRGNKETIITLYRFIRPTEWWICISVTTFQYTHVMPWLKRELHPYVLDGKKIKCMATMCFHTCKIFIFWKSNLNIILNPVMVHGWNKVGQPEICQRYILSMFVPSSENHDTS